MLLTTTPSIEGHPIREYRGIISAETIIGANFVKDFFARITDVFGGRSGSYERVLREGKKRLWPNSPKKPNASVPMPWWA